MQAEASDTSLREGIQALEVEDSEKSSADMKDETITEQQNSETVADEDAAAHEEAVEKVDGTEEEAQTDPAKADTGVDAEEGKQAAEEEWEIPYSDEEMEDAKSWMPPPLEIKRLYELLAKGEMLELNFVPLPRRPPTPERSLSPERDDEDEAVKERERQERERKPPTPTEFDFDEEHMQSTPKSAFINRRRTPGEDKYAHKTDLKECKFLNKSLLLLFRILRPFNGEKRSPPGQSVVRHEAPPQNRGAHQTHGEGLLQEREKAGGGALPKQSERAGQGEGARQQPQHHFLTTAEEILKLHKGFPELFFNVINCVFCILAIIF
ncbi:PAXIP1-associated glutamate-rich protein 1A [Oryzias melastigma]|uniref:PAXIP1-associated glutamate-rich protein 1A n=1 Tax=Oryzias melastigma TaxID=30732 RepID=A0A834FII2_ORYME|nr:PAXIP1-associated glutamate-rich protein 1A [Oryzias melastigma]